MVGREGDAGNRQSIGSRLMVSRRQGFGLEQGKDQGWFATRKKTVAVELLTVVLKKGALVPERKADTICQWMNVGSDVV